MPLKSLFWHVSGDAFLYRGIFTIEVFFYTIVDETCSAPHVVLVAIVTDDLVIWYTVYDLCTCHAQIIHPQAGFLAQRHSGGAYMHQGQLSHLQNHIMPFKERRVPNHL